MSDYDRLLDRMAQCQRVLDDLNGSIAWKIVLDDATRQCKTLDDNWQSIFDDEKLRTARVLKMAMKHIMDLPFKYEDELKALQKSKEVIDNPDKSIMRDYDAEGINPRDDS